MIFIATLLLGTALLFAAVVLSVEIGRRLGMARAGDVKKAGYQPIEGALFALLGLLLAFTFYGAASRFDQRRLLIVDEVNAIGTAYLRLQILPAAAQPALKSLFKEYVQARLRVYRNIQNHNALTEALHRTGGLQRAIWDKTIAAIPPSANASVRTLLLTSQNQMFDIASARILSTQMHPPAAIFILMLVIVLVCSVLSGIGMASSKERSWIHIGAFALILSATVYVIFDMEYPRHGVITVESFDEAIINLEKSI